MGKKAKEHRKKVEKRNRIIAQERQALYAIKNKTLDTHTAKNTIRTHST